MKQNTPSPEQYQSLQIHKPRTPAELWHLVKFLWNVEIPYKKVCPDHTPPFQAFSDAFFAKDSMAIWKASRGFGGKSFLLALLALTEQVVLGAGVNILGGSGEQSQRVLQYLSGEDPNAAGIMWDAPNAPKWMHPDDFTKRVSRTINGGVMKALMASATSVRGPHPQRLRLDEVDEMDIKIFDSAMGQTMAARGIKAQTVMSSTHQHADGTMTELLRRARDLNWPCYTWCYRENLKSNGGWLDDEEVARKKREVPEAMWIVEYENQEPNPEAFAIDPAAVEALFCKGLGIYRGGPNERFIIPPPTPRGRIYHGADWAKSKDWTVLHSMVEIPGKPDRLFAWSRMGRVSWPNMVAAFNNRVKEYPGSACHDITGLGSVINDYLKVNSFGANLMGQLRNDIFTNYIVAVERGLMEFPFIEWARQEHKYASYEDLYGGKHPPDSIVAAALSWEAKRRGGSINIMRI